MLNTDQVLIALKNLFELFEYRGYNIDDDVNTTVERILNHDEKIEFVIKTNNNKKIFVKFIYIQKIGKTELDKLLTEYASSNYKRHFYIFCHLPTKQSYKELVRRKNKIEMWLLEDLQYNPTKHALVPQHSILSQEETDQLLSELHCEKQNLPGIETTDIIVRWLNAKKGDVIKIIRNSVTLDNCKSIYFRCVRTWE